MQLLNYPDPAIGIAMLHNRLASELDDGKRVLWLLSGGSNIAVSVQVMDSMSDEQSKLLTVALIDERFGPEGHKDSNWQKLIDAGFNGKSAKHATVLSGNPKDLQYAAEQYGLVLGELFKEHDVIIGQYGMGADGHIAGILPQSPAVTAEGLVTAYVADDFERITTTFEAIRQNTVAYVFAAGADKRSALENLTRDLSLAEQPAQILKQLSESYVFNDQIGDNQ